MSCVSEPADATSNEALTVYLRQLPPPRLLPPWQWPSYYIGLDGRLTTLVIRLREYPYYDPLDDPEEHPGFCWLPHDVLRIEVPRPFRFLVSRTIRDLFWNDGAAR